MQFAEADHRGSSNPDRSENRSGANPRRSQRYGRNGGARARAHARYLERTHRRPDKSLGTRLSRLRNAYACNTYRGSSIYMHNIRTSVGEREEGGEGAEGRITAEHNRTNRPEEAQAEPTEQRTVAERHVTS